MKIVRLFKKFKHLTKTEEKSYASALTGGIEALDVVSDYLAIQVDLIDKELSCTKALYTGTGDRNLYVATLLANREAHYNLLLLLQTKVELDVDQTKD